MDGKSIGEKMRTEKSEYIETAVLNKLKKLDMTENNIKYFQLIEITEMSTGIETLRFINNLSGLDEKTMLLIKANIPVIKRRLAMLSLVKKYTPKNEFEKKIMNKIKLYSPIILFAPWYDEYSYDLYKSLKVGPLKDGKYLYIKLYIDPPKYSRKQIIQFKKRESIEYKVENPNKEVMIRVDVSMSPNGEEVYSYVVKSPYPVPVKNYDLIKSKWVSSVRDKQVPSEECGVIH